MKKLKINKNFTKRQRKKTINQKNKDWNKNTNNKEGQTVNFERGEIKKKKSILTTNQMTTTDTNHTTKKLRTW